VGDFERAYAFTLGSEGGYANDSVDAGGETWCGISRRANPDWPGWPLIDRIKAQRPADLDRALRESVPLRELRDALYRERYWTPLGLDACPWPLNLAAFDYAVHSGVARAAGDLANAKLFSSPTEGAGYLTERRALFLLRLVARKPSQEKYLRGWFARIVALMREIEAA
jgi:lysozyme family protein